MPLTLAPVPGFDPVALAMPWLAALKQGPTPLNFDLAKPVVLGLSPETTRYATTRAGLKISLRFLPNHCFLVGPDRTFLRASALPPNALSWTVWSKRRYYQRAIARSLRDDTIPGLLAWQAFWTRFLIDKGCSGRFLITFGHVIDCALKKSVFYIPTVLSNNEELAFWESCYTSLHWGMVNWGMVSWNLDDKGLPLVVPTQAHERIKLQHRLSGLDLAPYLVQHPPCPPHDGFRT